MKYLVWFSGLEVIRYPKEESVSLETDGRPLILSYIVCGTRDNLERFRFKITISQDGIGGGDVRPILNAPLIRDSTAEARGISASLWNIPSPDYEMCNEVPIRVWTDHAKVLNSTIELKLGIKDGRIPREYPGGKFRLYYPEKVALAITTSTPATEVATREEATESTTKAASSAAESTSATTLESVTDSPNEEQSPKNEESSLHIIKVPGNDEMLNCRCYCDQD